MRFWKTTPLLILMPGCDMKRVEVAFVDDPYPLPPCTGCIFNNDDGSPCQKVPSNCLDIDETTGRFKAYIWVDDGEEGLV